MTQQFKGRWEIKKDVGTCKCGNNVVEYIGELKNENKESEVFQVCHCIKCSDLIMWKKDFLEQLIPLDNQSTKVKPKKCNCNVLDLWAIGCKCGGE